MRGLRLFRRGDVEMCGLHSKVPSGFTFTPSGGEYTQFGGWEITSYVIFFDCQRWNGEYFAKDTLQNLGLRYQLGHSDGQCPCPEPGPKNFVVFDLSGPHWIHIDYCRCSAEPLSNWAQLFREKWFPATLTRPQTVFSFDCLETFHELTLQGKTSLYDFYLTLLRRSDNASLYTGIVIITLIY